MTQPFLAPNEIEVETRVIVHMASWWTGRKFSRSGYVVAFIPQGQTPSSVYPKCNCLAYEQLHNVPVP